MNVVKVRRLQPLILDIIDKELDVRRKPNRLDAGQVNPYDLCAWEVVAN